MDKNGFFYHPNTHLVRDNYVADEFPWILSEDIAHGVHYNGVLGDIVTDMSEGVSDMVTDMSEGASRMMR